MKNLGRTLAEARKSLNLTQWDVAEQLNVARTTVSNWELGRSQPDYRALCKLSEVLQCDLLSTGKENTSDQEEKGRKLQLMLSDSAVIDAVLPEYASVFRAGSIDLRINGSDFRGNPIRFHVFANFCVENDCD